MNVKNQFKTIGLALLLFSFSPIKTFAHNPNEARATGDGQLLLKYSWVEILNPFLLLFLAVVFVVYIWAINKVSTKHEVKHKLWKNIAFLLGLFTIYLALAGPVSIYANNLVFSAHMLQQALMYIAMPILILLGMPRVFYQFLDEKLFRIKMMRFFKYPLVSIILFNFLFSLYHFPAIYEYAWKQFILLESIHLILNSAAFLMWIHLLAPKGIINNMSYLMKIGYIFMNGFLLMPACALIIFSDDVLYKSINQAPQLFSPGTPQDDQQLGGIIINLAQSIFYSPVIAILFFKWAKEEDTGSEKIDELPGDVLE